MKSYLVLTVAAASLFVGMAQAGQGAINAHAQGQGQDDNGRSGDQRKQCLKNCFENHPEQKYSSDKAEARK
jgi:hypothetical protein